MSDLQHLIDKIMQSAIQGNEEVLQKDLSSLLTKYKNNFMYINKRI